MILQKKKFVVFIYLFCFILTQAFGQQHVIDNSSIRFYNLNEKYGLSIREVNSICEDSNGFIWASSKMGIIRYTPGDVRTYKLPYENSNVITTRLSFNQGHLYVYTNNGQIFYYNAIADQFELIINLATRLRNPYLFISRIVIDSKSQLWISSASGLFLYNKKDGLKVFMSGEYVYNVTNGPGEKLLLVRNAELLYFNPTDHKTDLIYKLPQDKVRHISSVKYDEGNDMVCIGTKEDGFFVLKNMGGQRKLIKIKDIPDQPVMSIENCNDSIIYVGVDGQGIWGVDSRDLLVKSVMKENVNNPNSLKGNGVYDIFCSSDKRVWVGTYSGGVSYFEMGNSEFKNYVHIINDPNSLVNNDVNSVIEDSDGNLWFATNNGISKYIPSSNKWKSYYFNNKGDAQVFLSICEDAKGRIWAGTYSSGVYVLNKNTGEQLYHYNKKNYGETFKTDFVFNIFSDLDHDIWIGGGSDDLTHYDFKTGKFSQVKDVPVNVIINYGKDSLLIATTKGLLVYNKRTKGTIKIINDYSVVDMRIKGRELWMCAVGQGVIKYNLDTHNIKQITISDGLPSNYTSSIEYVNGLFWVGSEQGLCSIDEKNFKVKNYTNFNGLNNVSFNDNAHTLLKNGDLLWGTNRGAILFNPEKIKSQSSKGQIYIQEIDVNGTSLRETEPIQLNTPIDSISELTLHYDQNNLSFELLPIFTALPQVKFVWKLEGLDQDWNRPVNSRILSYSNIPSGSYHLMIKMYDDSLSEVIAERTLAINITPPYWEMWWFKILGIVLFLSISTFFVLYYISRLKKRHSEEKIRFFSNTAHDMRTSLTLITAPIEELKNEEGLSKRGKSYLNMASEQAARFKNVVTRLMDFQKVDIGKEKLHLTEVDIVKFIETRVMMFAASAKRKKLELVFESKVNVCYTMIDEIVIEKIIDNLLSNAIKYSFEGTKIKIKLSSNDNKWKLIVKDQGIGIEKKAQKHLFKEYYRGNNAINAKIVGSGIGLLLVKNYINLHGGKITCDSQLNKGTTFTIVIPLNTKQGKDDNTYVSSSNDVNSVTESDVEVDYQEVFEKSDQATEMKVVIVEDNDYLRDFLATSLCDRYQVFLAENGRIGWEMICKHTPDMVVSDIMMPEMDGYELCSKIKSNYETSHIPVILLTALGAKEQQLQGLGLGADDYLVKPFDVNILRQRIDSIIQNREIIRERALKIIKLADNNETLLNNELNDSFLKKMVETVRDNLGNSEFSKHDFASAMNVSNSLLYKKVKALTNQSPSDFIRSIRLEHALELVQTKQYSVTEISEMCGFASVGYFSTVFRKHYGKTPSQIE
ncbi:hybrid sensor histidine kinase/response regulator transcription factor [Plebeiibacterium sediminum]|uniref:histidine kinase n=1 Tax=Plebeiibacterium sediminum TaxID=2992112 RepID=A0AAE3M983_9BACT|nr:hybrid sensor histidine kinase/response regulator transcription factor [Plebeiobacterium sediminum]MCW3789569.1 response regulator [Plebeiobacterium sediminum]